ncbi:glycosyltransferase [Patulibacter minatonensis]|uniref:glycosyltransferase n=1 Tax=Patulibacter minatonensis TaxID=298163 RepID=UPI0004BC7991|nr:glycosyltransferase [Patulibacter minatonensis]
MERVAPGVTDVTGAAPADAPVRVGYLMSRFPTLTETFILREMQGVEAEPGVEIVPMSLFPTPDRTVHEDAVPWVPRLYRPSIPDAVRSTLRWLVRRPVRTLGIWGRMLLDHRGEGPATIAKAVTTTALAFAHADHVERRGIQHVHAHFASLPALAAWAVQRLTGVPFSTTAHAHDVFQHQAGLRTKLRAASFVIAISRYHQMFLAHFGAATGHTRLSPLGLDLQRYAFREREIPREGPVDVLFVSSLRPYKGHRFLFRALAEDPRLARLRVDVVGAGVLQEELEREVAELGVQDQVVFSGGRTQEQVLERLGQAHVLVQPSIVEADGHTEGLPTTLVEAAASGVTMVASRVTGVPDLVRENETGFLADPGDVTGLADALARLLGHPDPRALQRAARAHVEEWHDVRRVSPRLVGWFRESALAGDAARR